MIILAAPLATTNDRLASTGNENEVDYLKAMYQAGAKPFFDAMSANAYGTAYAPEDPPSPGKYNFRRVEFQRQVMEANGDSAKAIWFNEYGWNASPADCCSSFPWARVTPEQQADYTVRGIQYAEQNWPWAGVFTIWYLRQVGDIAPTQSEYYFGLVNPDFVKSAAYRSTQQAAQADEQVASAGQWSPLAAPVQAGPDWQLHLDTRVPGGIYVAPGSTALSQKSSLNLTFQGTDVNLMLVPITNTASLTETTDLPARYYVTVDGSSANVVSQLPGTSRTARISTSPIRIMGYLKK